jgi:two-component system chemotaxis response regulator CheB
MGVERVIVIGASAGGVEAISNLVGQLPANLPAAVFVTQHLYQRSSSQLPEILSRAGHLPAKHPAASEPIAAGQIYVAPPDYHMVLSPGMVGLEHGPKENLQRPCINVMFRSAAASYGPGVVGVLLTGMLDDGASGLWGNQTTAWSGRRSRPHEAAFPSMPESAIRAFEWTMLSGFGS